MTQNLSRKKIVLFATLTAAVFFILLEIFCFLFFLINSPSNGNNNIIFPIIDFYKIKTYLKQDNYQKIKSKYFVFDPNLGVRFRPNSKLIALEATKDGTPRIAKQLSLTTDKYGFIANTNKTKNWRNYFDIIKNYKNYYVILVSGGSTTSWGASTNEKTWPAQLELMLNNSDNLLKRKYKKIFVINSGVFGYTISQEIKRFQEETIYFKPDIVVSFNGINEKYNYQGNPVDYSLSNYQIYMMNHLYKKDRSTTLFFPYISKVIHKLADFKSKNYQHEYGYKKNKYITEKSYNLYSSKVKQFYGLCKSHNMEFIHVLQPIMGIGNKKLSVKEERLKRFFSSKFYKEPWEKYNNRLNLFYKHVQQKIKNNNYKWQYDYSEVFDQYTMKLYSDPRHYNDEGHKIIAEKVYSIILNN